MVYSKNVGCFLPVAQFGIQPQFEVSFDKINLTMRHKSGAAPGVGPL